MGVGGGHFSSFTSSLLGSGGGEGGEGGSGASGGMGTTAGTGGGMGGGIGGGGGSGGLQIAHVETGEYVHVVETRGPAPCVQWHPGRYVLAWGEEGGRVRVLGVGG